MIAPPELIAKMQDRMMGSTYLGIRSIKNPLDWWVYQEIAWETRPDVIVEIGVHCGGTTLALAHLCDAIGHGRVIGVDVTLRNVCDRVRAHPRISFVQGAAIDVQPVVAEHVGSTKAVMVIEDSAHDYANTLGVLHSYSPMVGPGHYFVVEDSICHHGLDFGPKPGPYEAIEAFLRKNPDWESDLSRERFVLTWNPRGYLRRIR